MRIRPSRQALPLDRGIHILSPSVALLGHEAMREQSCWAEARKQLRGAVAVPPFAFILARQKVCRYRFFRYPAPLRPPYYLIHVELNNRVAWNSTEGIPARRMRLSEAESLQAGSKRTSANGRQAMPGNYWQSALRTIAPIDRPVFEVWERQSNSCARDPVTPAPN